MTQIVISLTAVETRSYGARAQDECRKRKDSLMRRRFQIALLGLAVAAATIIPGVASAGISW